MKSVDKYCKLHLIDGIVHAEYAEDAYIEIDIAKAIVEKRKKTAGFKPHPVLVKGGPISVSEEAKKYALTPQSSELIVAWAIVTDENLLKLLFYKLLFFTQNSKHRLRFFKNENAAIEWLKNEFEDFKEKELLSINKVHV